jgi:hypothetical protein
MNSKATKFDLGKVAKKLLTGIVESGKLSCFLEKI